MTLRAAIFALAAGLPVTAQAVQLDLPKRSVQSAVLQEAHGSGPVAIGPYTEGVIETISAEGAVTRTAWQTGSAARTTLQLLSPLRAQLIAAGYEVLYECTADVCGGFDFRYETPVFPEPDMHVDLGDFRYLSARLTPETGPAEFVTILVSRSTTKGYIQLTHIGGKPGNAGVVVASTKADDATVIPIVTGALAEQLETRGSVPLDDLDFASGSTSLGDRDYPSLAELAAYLKANPERSIVLVGHTDAVGSLAGNINLSRKRASSVEQRLMIDFNVSKSQVSSEGVGYLAPRASNLTEEGRTKNRRVEAMLASTR